MERERFISRPMSVALDLVRFLSALGVMVVHARELLGYTGPFALTPRFSHNCVIMFFVLSGLMIDHSVRSRPSTLAGYAAARAARIYPVAIPAMLLALLANTLITLGSGPLPPGYGGEALLSAFAGLSFLSQADFMQVYVIGDGAWWSLSYEVWYYILFAAAVFLKGRVRLFALPLLMILAGTQVLALLPVWLAGVWLNRDARLRGLDRRSGLAVLLGCILGVHFIATWDLDALLWLRSVLPLSLWMSEWLLSDLPLALVFVLALAALRPLAEAQAARLDRWRRPIRFAAGFSFTLYLFHGPLLCLLSLAGARAGDSMTLFGAGLLAVLAASAAIARVTEGSTPAIRVWIEDRFSRSRLPASAQSAALL